MKDNDKVTVCNKCLRASCWKGFFLCDEARSAGTKLKSVKELKKLNLENSSYWEKN